MTDQVRVTFYFCLGLLAASTIGVASFFLVELRTDLGLTPTMAGFAVSSITLVGAALGFAIGNVCSRFAIGTGLAVGLAVLGLSGIGAALSGDAATFIVTRIAAGIGFTVLVTGLPAAIARVDDPSARQAALVMWGSFLPLGIAIGVGISAVMLAHWRTALGVHGGICLLAGMMAYGLDRQRRMITPANRGQRSGSLLGDGNAVRFSVGFAAFAAIFLVAVTLLPSYLRTAAALDDATAGIIAAFICTASALTSLVLVFVLPRIRNYFPLFVVGFGGSAVAGTLFFLSTGTAFLGVFAGTAIIVLSAFISSTVFATLPLIVHEEKVGALSGLVAQMGSLGSLVGPPLVTWWTGHFGWMAGWIPFCSLCVIGVVLFLSPARTMRTARAA